jgi:uncharacterized protein YegJ (DUF2314 family)
VKRSSVIYFLSIFVLTAICSCSALSDKQDDWAKENIRHIQVGDKDVLDAFQAAQDSLVYFIDYFEKYDSSSGYHFYLKTSFSDKDEVEHMWSIPFEKNDYKFFCVLDNVPNVVSNYEIGDAVEIEFKSVEDCIITVGDTLLIGAYLDIK